MSFLWNDQGSSLACMLFAEAVVYGHSMLGFCSRLSTASLNHPPFTFYNARGLPNREMSSEDVAYKFICLRLCFGGTIAVSAQSVGKDSSFGGYFASNAPCVRSCVFHRC